MKKFLAIMLTLLLVVAMMSTLALAGAEGEAAATDIVAAEAATPDFGITPVVAIVVICYLVAAGLKATKLDNKWLPVICGLVGGALGYIAMGVIPDYPATDVLTAVAVGIVSGLAAVGVNQIYKQLGTKTE